MQAHASAPGYTRLCEPNCSLRLVSHAHVLKCSQCTALQCASEAWESQQKKMREQGSHAKYCTMHIQPVPAGQLAGTASGGLRLCQLCSLSSVHSLTCQYVLVYHCYLWTIHKPHPWPHPRVKICVSPIYAMCAEFTAAQTQYQVWHEPPR